MAKFEDIKNGGRPDRQQLTDDIDEEDLMNKCAVFELLGPREKRWLVGTLNRRVASEVLSTDEIKQIERNDILNKFYTLGRHGLNYAKLFLDFEGGYTMEELKVLMERVKKDKEDNIHPFIDPKENRKLVAKIKKTLN